MTQPEQHRHASAGSLGEITSAAITFCTLALMAAMDDPTQATQPHHEDVEEDVSQAGPKPWGRLFSVSADFASIGAWGAKKR